MSSYNTFGTRYNYNRLQKSFEGYLMTQGRSASTRRSYMRSIERFLAFTAEAEMTVETMRYNDILLYIESCRTRVGQRSIANYINAIRQYFDFLLHTNQISDHPVNAITIQGIPRQNVYDVLSGSQLYKMYEEFADDKQGHHQVDQKELLAAVRNRIMVGMMVFQGLHSGHLRRLVVDMVDIRKGTLHVPGSAKSNSRVLHLNAVQVFDLSQYLYVYRQQILSLADKHTDKLFTSLGSGHSLGNVIQQITSKLYKVFPEVESIKHIRASVITNWLGEYNLRQVQYMAGHRYVSSTEKYLANDTNALQNDVEQFHPLG